MTNTNEAKREAILHATLEAVRAGAVSVREGVRVLSPLLGAQPSQADLHDLQQIWLSALGKSEHWLSMQDSLDHLFDSVEHGPATGALWALVKAGRVVWSDGEVHLAAQPDQPDRTRLWEWWVEQLRGAQWVRVTGDGGLLRKLDPAERPVAQEVLTELLNEGVVKTLAEGDMLLAGLC